MKSSFLLLLLFLVVALGGSFRGQAASLEHHFYKKSCPQAEEIVQDIIWKHVANNSELPAKFLRMFFHDCFVRGCDASVLINSTANSTAEKDAAPNLSLAGFDVIDEVKTALEKTCPDTVSCADIIALAARDSVSFQFNRSLWEVQTGRRDGTISLASEARANIPSPFSNFTTLANRFTNKTLDVEDLVVLSGAHTIGIGHCNFFSNRLYNFTGKGDADPSLNATYAAFLKTQCKSLSDNTTTVPMDPGSSLTFDTHYYENLKLHQGMFQSDAALLTDQCSANIIDKMLDTTNFFNAFKNSIKRMGTIEVLTGTNGEIRKKCSVVNSRLVKMKSIFLLFLVLVVAFGGYVRGQASGLKYHFYKKSCPEAEPIIQDIIWKRVAERPELAAKFLRMLFHDCFVRGCDASVLINSTANNSAEKDAVPNLSLAGFDVIDEVKAALENACPDTVSCADIIALAARDSVSFQFKRPLWEVQTGRRDGTISKKSEALANIPAPTFNFTTLVRRFASKTLDVKDLVVLSGAHTIGVGLCNFFSNRLYNFTGKGDADPSLNPPYAAFLRTQCKSLSDNTTSVPMDPGSSLIFDTHYYENLKMHQGLFQSDAALLTNQRSVHIVDKMLNTEKFFHAFKNSIKRMGAIEVLTGTNGQIRKKCSVVNS
uniref:Peroxidase 1 n=1 Tax=Elaeis guineensis var. tenera TaxID=51953 RepID=A0A6I9QSH0_ELAGV|nr:uncharacterized protein LOC105039804 [Elaeis guineensis]